MSTRNLIRTADFPYHVTGRANNREWFHLPLDEVWPVFSENCYAISLAYGVRIQAFVLMNNHYHLILTTPDQNIAEAMLYLCRSISRTINLKSGRSGHVFGGRYKWSIVNSCSYYFNVLKYVYRNPIKAGICNQVEDYKFSTLPAIIGAQKISFPLCGPPEAVDSFSVPEHPFELLAWLNEPHSERENKAISIGLRRSEFSPPRDPKTLRATVLDAPRFGKVMTT